MKRFVIFSIGFLLVYFDVESQNIENLDPQRYRKLRIAVYNEPPFILHDLNGSIYGLSMDLWKYIAEENGWEYEIIEYDHILEVLYDLTKGNVDVCINPSIVTSTRLRQLEFTQPFFISSLGIAIHKKTNSQLKLFLSNIFSLEFAKLVMFLIVIVFLFGTVIWLIERGNKNKDFRGGFKGILDGLWWSAVTVTTVGYGDKTPKTGLGRAVSMIWMFAAITLISSFTATITSTLTLKTLDLDINSLRSVEKIGKLGIVVSSPAEDYLNAEKVNTSMYFNNINEALTALNEQKVDVIVHDKSIIRYLVSGSDDLDQIDILPLSFNKQYFSFTMPRRSPLLKSINPYLVDRISHQQWADVLRGYNLQDLD